MPAITLRLKRYRRRFGVLSPRVVVRRHVPHPLLWLLAVLLAVVVFGLGWVAANYWDAGREGVDEVDLQGQLQLQQDELAVLRSVAGSAQNALNIERASHQQLILKIGVLEAENAALKEEVKVFERLVPSGAEAGFRANRKLSR